MLWGSMEVRIRMVPIQGVKSQGLQGFGAQNSSEVGDQVHAGDRSQTKPRIIGPPQLQCLRRPSKDIVHPTNPRQKEAQRTAIADHAEGQTVEFEVLKKELKGRNFALRFQGPFDILAASGQIPVQILVQQCGQNIGRKGGCKAPNGQFSPFRQLMYLFGHPQKYTWISGTVEQRCITSNSL